MNKEDYITLIIAAAKDEPLTLSYIDKALFLISKNCSDLPEDFYTFEHGHFGPKITRLYDEIENLCNQKLVLRFLHKYQFAEYYSTHSGRLKANKLHKELNPRVSAYIVKIVNWMQTLSFVEVSKSICDKYPEYTPESIYA